MEPQQKHSSGSEPLWLLGFQVFLKSQAACLIFSHLRPEDKHLFISQLLVDPVLQM